MLTAVLQKNIILTRNHDVCIEQDLEIEYVEGDFEDNDDMEDFGGPVIDKDLIDDSDDEDVDNGKYTVLRIIIDGCFF